MEVLNKSHFSLQMGNRPIPVAEHSGLSIIFWLHQVSARRISAKDVSARMFRHQGHFGNWTFRHQGRFGTWTFRPLGRFGTWTFRPLDVSAPRHFGPWTFRPQDILAPPNFLTTDFFLSVGIFFHANVLISISTWHVTFLGLFVSPTCW